MTSQGSTWRAAGAVALAVLITSCGSTTPEAIDEARAVTPGTLTPDEVRNAFSSLAYDYTPVDSTAELVNRSDVVISGALVNIAVGRLEDPGDKFEARNSALKVTVTAASKGRIGVGDMLWIELPIAPDQLERTLPAGLPITAYLVPAAQDKEDYHFSYKGSEVSSSADLWRPAHAQGLIFELQQANERGTRPFEPLTGVVHSLPEK